MKIKLSITKILPQKPRWNPVFKDTNEISIYYKEFDIERFDKLLSLIFCLGEYLNYPLIEIKTKV